MDSTPLTTSTLSKIIISEQQTQPPLSDSEPQTTTTTTTTIATIDDVTDEPHPDVISEPLKWPGWPGHCVFRLVVPVLKVGSIIGRKGELIKKMCEETRARIRVLDGPAGTSDRVVLITGKEEPDAPLSPAMCAVVRIFKRVTGLPETEGDITASDAAAIGYCSIRLLVAATQAINLIGKQGTSIKSVQESSGASVRVLSENEVPFYASSDDRIVEVQGEALKVLKALELVLGHLRKFLVDQTVLPLFEKSSNTTPQDRQVESRPEQSLMHTASQAGVGSDYALSSKRESLFFDRERQFESQIPASGLSLYRQDTGLPGLRSSALGRAGTPIVTQVTQTMQIPLSYAEDIIGIGGANIAYIRRTSGAILTVQESRGLPDEITVEIKGTSSQVQAAQQLIQEFISNHKEPIPNSYGQMDTGLRSSYSQLGTYAPSSMSSQPYGGGYGSSGGGGYSSFRL